MEEWLQKKTGVIASMVLLKNNTASGLIRLQRRGGASGNHTPQMLSSLSIESFRSDLAKKRKVPSKVHFRFAIQSIPKGGACAKARIGQRRALSVCPAIIVMFEDNFFVYQESKLRVFQAFSSDTSGDRLTLL